MRKRLMAITLIILMLFCGCGGQSRADKANAEALKNNAKNLDSNQYIADWKRNLNLTWFTPEATLALMEDNTLDAGEPAAIKKAHGFGDQFHKQMISAGAYTGRLVDEINRVGFVTFYFPEESLEKAGIPVTDQNTFLLSTLVAELTYHSFYPPEDANGIEALIWFKDKMDELWPYLKDKEIDMSCFPPYYPVYALENFEKDRIEDTENDKHSKGGNEADEAPATKSELLPDTPADDLPAASEEETFELVMTADGYYAFILPVDTAGNNTLFSDDRFDIINLARIGENDTGFTHSVSYSGTLVNKTSNNYQAVALNFAFMNSNQKIMPDDRAGFVTITSVKSNESYDFTLEIILDAYVASYVLESATSVALTGISTFGY